jgi:Ca2+-binding EF-hand superfamily protein
VGYLKWSGINAQSVLKLADKDRSQTIELDEFSHLLTDELKFRITKEEIEEIFMVINRSETDKITVGELSAILP